MSGSERRHGRTGRGTLARVLAVAVAIALVSSACGGDEAAPTAAAADDPAVADAQEAAPSPTVADPTAEPEPAQTPTVEPTVPPTEPPAPTPTPEPELEPHDRVADLGFLTMSASDFGPDHEPVFEDMDLTGTLDWSLTPCGEPIEFPQWSRLGSRFSHPTPNTSVAHDIVIVAHQTPRGGANDPVALLSDAAICSTTPFDFEIDGQIVPSVQTEFRDAPVEGVSETGILIVSGSSGSLVFQYVLTSGTVGVTIHGTTAQTDSLAVFEVYKPIIDAVRTRLLQCETDVACLPAA